ncbi:hypothetical protein S40288_04621 [Stachybotrys chartarum IBT 40288]|nr:hypothetical protein S40288_04621 [Stachybotrys chartarum IBT 40288]
MRLAEHTPAGQPARRAARQHPAHSQNSDKPCDTGTPVPELEQLFPQVDFSHVDPVFPDKTSDAGALYKYNRKAILARAQSVLADLSSRPEKVIAVVSHSAFLRQGVTGYWYFNADYRIFDLTEAKQGEGQDPKYELKQWELTKAGGMGLSWEDAVDVGTYLPEETV